MTDTLSIPKHLVPRSSADETATGAEPSANSSHLKLDLVRDDAAFLALEPDWDSLVDRSATRSPFLRWDWVRMWWEEHASAFNLAVGVVRDPLRQPLAIAPLVLGHDAGSARRHLKHLAFLGGIGDARSERMDFIVPRGEEHLLTPVLASAFRQLRGEWDTVRLNKLPEESPNLPHLLNALRECGAGTVTFNRHESRYIPLPSTWQAYEAEQSKNWRSKLRRRWKAMIANHGARMLLAGRDAAPSEAYACLTQLHTLRIPAEVSLVMRERTQRFLHRIADRWLATGRAILPFIQIEDRIIAGMYGFIDGDEFFQFQMGWDPQYQELSPGKLAMAWCIQCALERQVRIYDMLPGDYDYKRQWCKGVRHVVDIESFNPASPPAMLFRALRAAKRLIARGAPAPRSAAASEEEVHS